MRRTLPHPGKVHSHGALFRLVAAVVFPLLFFAVVEGALRVGGYGYDPSFFKKARIGGDDYFVNNDDFVFRFFPPQLARLPGALRMEAEKPPGTCRIFILGESAALGDPSPPYGAGRYLEALMSERYPGRRFEVVNVAITAINSHAIVAIARECARRQGDFWVIYMGNNEMVGPYGAASVFGAQAPPRWMVRASLALQETRAGQGLMALTRGLRKTEAASWGGMEMFMGRRIAPGDARKETVYRNFGENLRDIVSAGLDSGARVILNTVAVNLKDCPPFASVPATNVAPGAVAAQEAGRFGEAARLFAQAAGVSPHCADLEYRLGQCLLALTNVTAARDQLQEACDDDLLPFRADSRINGIIRQAGAEFAGTNLVFCDTAAEDIAGEETFYEHVHFNFDGNYRLARAWAEKIGPLLAPDGGRGAAANWAPQEDCERRLGLTDWNRALILSEVMRRRSEPPLSGLSDNAARLERLAREAGALRQRMSGARAADARSLYTAQIQGHPEDYQLRFNYGDFLEGVGDAAEAAAQWRQVEELLPEYYLGYLQEGRMLERLGQLDAAAACFERTVRLHPRTTTAWFELSNIHASQGRYPEALGECERARRLEPRQPAFYACLGRIFSKMNDHTAAIEKYREAVKIRPEYFDGHLVLGEELLSCGRATEAKSEFEEARRLRPEAARAHFDLGLVLLQQGQRDPARHEFEETVRLDPGNKLARQYLERL
ncbi:MAG: tetratricopeptide repeat protein [Verrucomicrobiota bacterium]